MSVTITSATKISPGIWRVTYASTLADPTYYIYLDGNLVETTTETTAVVSAAPGHQLALEILDATGIPAATYPGRAVLQWYETSGATAYRVEEYVSGEWVVRARLTPGRWHYRWASRYLEDSAVHQLRVVPVSGDLDGTPAAREVHMVRRPDAPETTVSYDEGTATITVEET